MSVMDIKQIGDALGVIPPYQLLDRAEVEGSRASAIKNVSASDPFFLGHFPGRPIMPGVLQLEAMAQLAAITWRKPDPSEFVTLERVNKVKFRRPVVPGDQLYIEVELGICDETGVSFTAKAYTDDEVTCEADMRLGAKSVEDIGPTCLRPTEQPDIDVPASGVMTIDEIEEFIPHRFPFLLVDRVVGYRQEENLGEMTAIKNVTATEANLYQHPQGYRWLPNALQLEAAAQSGCVYTLSRPENLGKIAYFMSIENTVFHRAIVPGDQLRIVSSLRMVRQRFGQATGRVYVGAEVASEISLKFALMDAE